MLAYANGLMLLFCLFLQDLAMSCGMAVQLEGEAMHYRTEAVRGSFATGHPVPLPQLSMSRHCSGSHRPLVGGSRATSQASSSGSVRQPAQPPTAPPLVPLSVPPSAPEGEGESAT